MSPPRQRVRGFLSDREAAFYLGIGREELDARADREPLLAVARRRDGERVGWIRARLDAFLESLETVEAAP